jgi:DNA-binding NarL/FixJ family response regulator
MSSSANTHFVIADDHPLFRGALRQTLTRFLACTVDEAGSFDELTTLLEEGRDVDLIFLDLMMPGISGFFGLIYLRAKYPVIPTVIVSANDNIGTIRRAVELGASGFFPKRYGIETLREAIKKVMDGEIWIPPDIDLSIADPDMMQLGHGIMALTPQQVRVLMMLSEGLGNRQMASELKVAEETVKAHVSEILQKLDVESRTQAVIEATRIAGGQGWQDRRHLPE